MSRSTKTSEALRLLALTLAVLLLALALPARAAVVVRVSTETGRGTAASVRPRALDSALSTAVATIANRHTSAEQRAQLGPQLKALIARAPAFVTRYSIDEESVDAQGVYRMKLGAEVDTETLLAELERAGFKVYRMPAPPRVLVAPAAEGHSQSAALILVGLFQSEGVTASYYDQPAASLPDFSRTVLAKGFHVGVVVSVDNPGAGTEQEVGPEGPVPGPTPGAGAEPSGPTTLELSARAEMFAANSEGESMAKAELAVVVEGQDEASATREADERSAEELFQVLMAELVKSDWKLGSQSSDITIRVTNLDSPGDAVQLTALFSALSEFRAVSLSRVESRAAVWSVKAVGSGAEWLAALAAVNPEKGTLTWKKPEVRGGDKPFGFEAKWSPRR